MLSFPENSFRFPSFGLHSWMADIVDKATRSRMMSGIRGRDTKPELMVRRFLHRLGFRYRLHVRTLPGRPDIVLPKYRSAVFVHGCFWHQHAGCRFAVMPRSNSEFWRTKLNGNVERDAVTARRLSELGWRALTIWECEVENEDALRKLAANIVEERVVH